ncbi:putative helicase mov-10-B.1 [Leuresthes tenuis]|uniref:putative helicase mov-10-B.1 n=1 Tax=Leuresthes tenuis TaxID=355514 RepID=UPI003B502D44
MPKHLFQSLESGLEFIEFLGDRINFNNSKTEIRSIYNTEFKGRDGQKHPNFSSVLFALLKFNKVHLRQGRIYSHVKPQIRVYSDQWRRTRAPRKHSLSSRDQKTQALVLTPKNKVATDILSKMRLNREEMTADKQGIEITSEPAASGGKVQFTVSHHGEPFIVTFHIVNKGPNNINFIHYTALSRIRCFTLMDERRVSKACPLFLCPGESYDVKARFTLKHSGFFPVMMYFEFIADLPTPAHFAIVREIEAAVQTPLAVELRPVAPYEPFKVATFKPDVSVVVEGEPPEGSTVQNATAAVKLGEYKCPKYLKELAKHGLEYSKHLSLTARNKFEEVKSVLNSSLSMKNYSRRFHLLLYLEEIQMEVDIRKYDLRNQTMTQDQGNRKLLILKVPGVAENRPSVLRGDCLWATKSAEKSSPITVYTGYVHKVELDRVKLGFSKKLLETFISNMKFDVEFTVNRLTLKLQQRAVDLAVQHRLEEVLFPSGAAAPNVPLPELSMFNRQLEDNPEQRDAVRRIAAQSSKPAPYIVFGPPGTGKTITLVEAIKQVNRANPSAHILACAPSNSACDLLCERLTVHTNSYQVYRMYAYSRDPSSIPKNLLKYSNWDDRQGCFVFPEKEILMKYTVIITTLFTAGRLVTGGIPVGHFSHVFVDEAGQAAEPECAIAFAGLLSAEKGQLVLAGDPEQLGPILRSPFAIQYGLELSLLERLMKHELYRDFDTRFVTKLLRNYRSHGAILKIPNELFYQNELLVFADQMECEAYCNWDDLPKKGFPVIFHGVMGKDEREANSPSFFNVSEIEILVSYLTKLVETQGKKGLPKLSPKDIGIITPYRKQVEKIQKALKSVPALSRWTDLKELKVGSVEEFQGQERKIIMVSTVRSSSSYFKMDRDYNIGFLSNKKRFNVALTRAKSLLIVIGNPVILKTDPIWEKFISYCEEMKGYAGLDLKYEEEKEFVARMASLRIFDSEQPADEEREL